MEVDRAAGYHSGDGVLVDHLGHSIAQQHHVLVERFDVTLQLDAVDQVDRHRNMLFAQQVQEGVLKKLPFVAHGFSPCRAVEVAETDFVAKGDNTELLPYELCSLNKKSDLCKTLPLK